MAELTIDAADIAAALYWATDAFSSGPESDDDRTVLVLRGVGEEREGVLR